MKITTKKRNYLRGKDEFTVSDLKSILNRLDDDLPIIFGVITDECTSFSQNDNFIFDLDWDPLRDSTLMILTDHTGY